MLVSQWVKFYLTEQQVSDVENHAQGELGSEEGEKPLRGVHVCLQVELLEVGPQVWKLFLEEQIEDKARRDVSDIIAQPCISFQF